MDCAEPQPTCCATAAKAIYVPSGGLWGALAQQDAGSDREQSSSSHPEILQITSQCLVDPMSWEPVIQKETILQHTGDSVSPNSVSSIYVSKAPTETLNSFFNYFQVSVHPQIFLYTHYKSHHGSERREKRTMMAISILDDLCMPKVTSSHSRSATPTFTPLPPSPLCQLAVETTG